MKNSKIIDRWTVTEFWDQWTVRKWNAPMPMQLHTIIPNVLDLTLVVSMSIMNFYKCYSAYIRNEPQSFQLSRLNRRKGKNNNSSWSIHKSLHLYTRVYAMSQAQNRKTHGLLLIHYRSWCFGQNCFMLSLNCSS